MRSALVGQREVVRARLGRDADAAPLPLADQLDGARRRDVLDVQPAAGDLGQADVAGDHDVLGRRGHAARPEPHRLEPLVHHAAAVSSMTWQCCMTTRSNIFEYYERPPHHAAEATGAPSSVNATAPPSTSWPISASSSPLRPLVTAPTG